jgi:type VI protein secretion system component Hcp
MTSKDMRAAVERLMTDPEFAQHAYEDPEKVLPIEYDLDPAQWQAGKRQHKPVTFSQEADKASPTFF